jgi:hypothetical protein
MELARRLRHKSQQQEKRTAKEFKGKTQIASGALQGLKGDVRTGTVSSSLNENDFLIENKFTEKDRYPLKKSIWDKIEKEATRDNLRFPLMQIDIQDLKLVVALEHFFYNNELEGFMIRDVNAQDKRSHVIVKKEFEQFLACNRRESRQGVWRIRFSDKSLILMEKKVFLHD